MYSQNLEKFKSEIKLGLRNDKPYFYKRTEEDKQLQTDKIPALMQFFKDECNVILYPIYGTLLGIIRENDYILHDYDIDFAYLSNYNTKPEIIKEYSDICDILLKNDLLAKKCRTTGQLHCYDKEKIFKYDIWTSFIIDNRVSIIPTIDGHITAEDILPFTTRVFRNIIVNIPNNPQKILNSIYDEWEKPILGNLNYRGLKLQWKKIL